MRIRRGHNISGVRGLRLFTFILDPLSVNSLSSENLLLAGPSLPPRPPSHCAQIVLPGKGGQVLVLHQKAFQWISEGIRQE